MLEPTTTSLLYRTRLSALLSPLKRLRPRVPFNKLAAHRIPTLWSLYRGLLRHSPSDEITWWIRRSFRKQKAITSPKKCLELLQKWHKYLDYFHDNRKRAVLRRYSKLLAFRRDRENMGRIYANELAWINQMRRRPIMTGGYHRPTHFNKPLPRLKPQPIHITMMITSRMRARISRAERLSVLKGWRDDIRAERHFEHKLIKERGDAVYDTKEWEEPILNTMQSIDASFQLDTERRSSVYTPEMIASIKRARREKVENKTRERLRQRKGELTNQSLKLMRKRPPAHILVKMSAREQFEDRVRRERSIGGFSGKIKRANSQSGHPNGNLD